MKLVEVAEAVLTRHGSGRPMHFTRMTALAVSEGLITDRSLTPDSSVELAIANDIRRRSELGDDERFISYGRGYFGLAHHRTGGDLEASVRQHNLRVRERLHSELREMDPG